MFSKTENISFGFSNTVSLGAFAFLATSTLLFASAIGISSWNSGNKVIFESNSFSWISSIELKADKVESLGPIELPAINTRKFIVKNFSHHQTKRKVIRSLIVRSEKTASQRITDKIPFSISAPTAAVPPVEKNEITENLSRGRLVEISRTIRSRFIMVMAVREPAKNAVIADVPALPAPAREIRLVPVTLTTEIKPLVSEEPNLEEKKLDLDLQMKPVFRTALGDYSHEDVGFRKTSNNDQHWQPPIRTFPSRGINSALSDEIHQTSAVEEPTKTTPVDFEYPDEYEDLNTHRTNSAPKVETTSVPNEEVPTPAKETTTVPPPASGYSFLVTTHAATTPVSIRIGRPNGLSRPAIVAQNNIRDSNPDPSSPPVPQAGVHDFSSYFKKSNSLMAQANGDVDVPPHADSQTTTGINVPTYVEAFSWTTPVYQAATESLTHERLISSGWTVSNAENHWPTLCRGQMSTIPLLLNNTALLLARTTTTADVLGESGIVFGKLPAGWSVGLSARSESVLVFDGQSRPVNNDSPEPTVGDRYFIFLNVAPGSQIVTLNKPSVKENAAIGVPVLAGTATYVDLSQVKKRSFSGRVFDGGSGESAGMKNVNVHVIGQSQAVGITDANGDFSIDEAYSLEGFPVYFETNSGTGFTHRYAISSDQKGQLILYRMGNKQIEDWIGQLEGGISPESSLIVAAVPGIVGEQGDGNLFPSFVSLNKRPNLKPETYTVGPSGQLLVHNALTAESSRMVTVQVPDGPGMIQVEDKSQHIIWSELLMNSPGVINVVGPY